MINILHASPITRLQRTLTQHQWYCQIFHWRYREPMFGGYGFGGRTNRQTGVYCSKCHTTRAVHNWQEGTIVKSDTQITAEVDKYGHEQLTPKECWRNGKWVPRS